MQNKKRKSEDGDNAMIIPQEVIDQALQGNEAEDYGGFEAEDTQIIHIDELKARQRLRVKEALRQRRNSESKEYNEVQRETDVIYIPDIHGDLTALRNSLTNLGVINEHDEWVGGKSVVVFSGDYIDRGEENLAVLDFVWNLQEEAELRGGKVELLLGNHEAAMLAGLLGDKFLFYTWLSQGGLNVLINVAEHYNFEEKDWLVTAKSFNQQELIANFTQYGDRIRSINALYNMFFQEGGRYHEMLNEMKVFTQVDDILYVHAGINLEWSQYLKEHGVDGLNYGWQAALSESQNNNFERFKLFNQVGAIRNGKGIGGPFWADFDGELEKLPEQDIAQIAQNLKSIGVNAIVVGHSIKKIPTMSERFNKYGIKLIAADVGMSNYYTKGESGRGGVKTDIRGNIRAQSKEGVHNIYDALKIQKGDFVQIYRNRKLEKDWQITNIDGDEVLLARQVYNGIERVKVNIDYLNKLNPKGGRKEK